MIFFLRAIVLAKFKKIVIVVLPCHSNILYSTGGATSLFWIVKLELSQLLEWSFSDVRITGEDN